MIGPKVPKPTEADNRRAYKVATARNDGMCELCHHREGQRHHRQGRTPYNTVVVNLLLACHLCHAKIHAEPEWARERGYIVSDSIDPAVIPVLYWVPTALGGKREAWVLLTDRGTFVEAKRRIADGHLYEAAN